MSGNTRIFWLQALAPLHVGSGRGVGFVDLPLVREKATGWPVVPGSTMKGVMRDHFTQDGSPSGTSALVDRAFGRGGQDTSLAGALSYSDARLVLLPVRSLYGTFAYATSRLALQWLARDLAAAGVKDVPDLPERVTDQLWRTTTTVLKSASEEKVYLEDLDLVSQANSAADEWAKVLARGIFADETAWAQLLSERLAILPDDIFDYFTSMGTEIVARIKIDADTKTVTSGALWYEEHLPAETVLAGLAWCDRVHGGPNGVTPRDLLAAFCDKPIACQIGGKATVGKGRVRVAFAGGGQ
jgi:CRISPR-associated protein Cmr4